jgi:cytochrome c553
VNIKVKTSMRFILGASLLAACAAQQARAEGDAAKGQQLATTVCVACHGADGNSVVPNFPKLAGHHAGYIVKQLKDLKAGKQRSNDIMAPIVANLSEADMENAAAFFSKQKAAPGVVGNPALLDAGKKLWTDGNPATGIPACAGCHGPTGEGDDTYPHLAGQHPTYLIEQLKLFKTGKRKNDKKLMQTVAIRLTDDEIKAVAEYAASLQK